MYPVLFHFGSIVIHSYGVMLMLGFLAGLALTRRQAPRHGLSPDLALDLGVWILLASVVFARVLFLALSWSSHPVSFLDAIAVWREAGLSFFGGLWRRHPRHPPLRPPQPPLVLGSRRRLRSRHCPGLCPHPHRLLPQRLLLWRTHEDALGIIFPGLDHRPRPSNSTLLLRRQPDPHGDPPLAAAQTESPRPALRRLCDALCRTAGHRGDLPGRAARRSRCGRIRSSPRPKVHAWRC